MGLFSLLRSCFGDYNKAPERPLIIDGAYQEPYLSPSKSPEIVVRSQDSLESAQSYSIETNRQPSNKALCVVSKGTYEVIPDISFPTIASPDEVIIQTKAVGLNPIDWKAVDYNFCMPSFPWINGRELAGTVVQIGSKVQGLEVGDVVWASTYYRDRRAGTFQEYVVCPQHTVLPLPSNISIESGACLGVAALTAAMTIWKWLNIPLPMRNQPQVPSTSGYILIWGGSTVTGQFATQFAVLSGLEVITVTSARTKPLVEKLGASHVIVRDAKSNAEILAEIQAIVGDDLTCAIDIVGKDTAAYCIRALSTKKLGILAPLNFINDDEPISSNHTIANVEMKRFVIEGGNKLYADMMNELISAGKLVFPEIELMEGGLERIEEGLTKLKRGDMGGKKLVVVF